MDTNTLQYRLTESERETFERDGYFIVEDAISPKVVADLNEALDAVDAADRIDREIDPGVTNNILDFIGRDDRFLPLLDLPETFTKVWDILGWNIQLYHSHTIITPPGAPYRTGPRGGLGWHQDSGRLNWELETNPQPRISLKVAFFLTDTTDLGHANLYVVPGSHVNNELAYASDDAEEPTGAVAVRVKPGTAVFFDRRIWHASSPNVSDISRKVLFYGYSYRWLRPRDNMTVEHYFDRCTPIQRQLLGYAPTGKHGYSSPRPEDVPLKAWLEENVGEERVLA
ncbi:MAG: phytanoyl-CoA dioxygenase family protein [Chloroflexota bacterium]